jgi:hypothetical protein
MDTMIRNWVPGGAAGMEFVSNLMKGITTPPKRD